MKQRLYVFFILILLISISSACARNSENAEYSPPKPESAKADTYDSEMLLQAYESALIEAVNQNDFSLVAKYLVKDSELFQFLNEYVKDQHNRGITQRLVSYDIEQMEQADTDVKLYVRETVSIRDPSLSSDTEKTEYWIYTSVVNDGEAGLSKRETWNNRSLEEENPAMNTGLSNEQALELRAAAVDRFYTVFSEGGEQCAADINERAADVEEGFYYYCSDLNSVDKIKSYLEEVYTQQTTEGIMAELTTKVIDGKLAYRPADGGSYLDWELAEASLKEDSDSRKLFEFAIPDPEGIKQAIQIEYVNESEGWRIVTDPVNMQ